MIFDSAIWSIFSKLSENHKKFDIGSTEFKLWQLKESQTIDGRALKLRLAWACIAVCILAQHMLTQPCILIVPFLLIIVCMNNFNAWQ